MANNSICPVVDCIHKTDGSCRTGLTPPGRNFCVPTEGAIAKEAGNIFKDTSMAPVFVEPQPKILGTVTNNVDDTQILVGSTLRIDTIFSHELQYNRGTFEITPSDETLVAEAARYVVIDRHTLRWEYTVLAEGSVTFDTKFTDVDGVESTGTVACTFVEESTPSPEPKPEVSSITATPSSITVGEDVTVTIKFTKVVEDAADVAVTAGSELTVKTPFSLGADKTSGTAVYTGNAEGTGVTISAKTTEGTETKAATVDIATA